MRFVAAIAAVLTVVLAAKTSATPPTRVSTLADQRSVGVTIYNSSLALVRDTRRLDLPAGESRLALRDVSAQITPETALLASVGAPRRIRVLEQNFDYDLLSPQTMLAKYVGHDVYVLRYDPRTGTRRKERARVLSVNDGVVLQYADRIETSVNGELSFPSLPPNLRDRPTLSSEIDNAAPGKQDVELTYLTSGLSWKADYTALLDKNDGRLDLHGLVTLQNASGTTYRNAGVQLVAGDVNVAQQALNGGGILTDVANKAVAVTQQALLEYHLYTLPRRTTVADNQTKQVALMQAANVPVVKSLELLGGGFDYRSRQARSDLGTRLKVGSFVTFRNAGGDLGIPLPAGVIRVFKRDAAGRPQFVGSDTIDHTPRNETVRLALGSSFDVTAHEKQTDFRVIISGKSYESAYEIVVRNAKPAAESVLVVEPIPGDWTMLATSAPYSKSSSSTATWNLRVPAGGSTTLTYRVRTVF